MLLEDTLQLGQLTPSPAICETCGAPENLPSSLFTKLNVPSEAPGSQKRKMPKSSWFRVTVDKIQQLKRTIGSTSLDGPPPTCFWQTSNFKKQIQFYFLYSSLSQHLHVHPFFSSIFYFTWFYFILLKENIMILDFVYIINWSNTVHTVFFLY